MTSLNLEALLFIFSVCSILMDYAFAWKIVSVTLGDSVRNSLSPPAMSAMSAMPWRCHLFSQRLFPITVFTGYVLFLAERAPGHSGLTSVSHFVSFILYSKLVQVLIYLGLACSPNSPQVQVRNITGRALQGPWHTFSVKQTLVLMTSDTYFL